MTTFYDQYIGWAEETTWATAVARATFVRPHPGTFLRHMKPLNPTAELGRRDHKRHWVGVESGEGNLILPLSYDGELKLFKHLFGAVATSGAGPYTHTFTVSDGPPFNAGSVANAQGLTFEAHAALPDAGPLEAWRLDGALIDTGSLSFSQNQQMLMTLGVIGQKVTQVVKTAGATVTSGLIDLDTYEVIPSQITVSVDATDYSAVVEGVDLQIQNNLRRDIATLGSAYIRQPRPGSKRSISGTLRMQWEASPSAKTLYDKFLSKTSAAIIVTCTGPSSRTMTLTLNTVKFTGETPELVEGGILPVNLPFTAEYDATHTAAKLVVVNQTATV